MTASIAVPLNPLGAGGGHGIVLPVADPDGLPNLSGNYMPVATSFDPDIIQCPACQAVSRLQFYLL